MNKLTIAILATFSVGTVQADYQIKIPLDDNIHFFKWVQHDPNKSSWSNTGSIHDCSNWSPLTSSITINQSYTQKATDCKQNQVRTVQDREKDTVSGAIKNIGSPYSESQTILVSSERDAVGTKETWGSTTSTYTTWSNNGRPIECSNWSPNPNTVTINQQFTQTATDCKQPQTRSRQDREQESTTNDIRNVGSPVTENQSIVVSLTRSSTGTKETWAVTTPTYTTWTNNGVVIDCSNWTPSPATVAIGQSFTQTATDCKQPQTRSRQDREQESTTKAYRNTGDLVTENQNIVASSSRISTGTKESWVATTSTYTVWTNNSAVTGCSNWTPSPATVTIGQSFTQTATDCQQSQVRSRQDREQETTTKEIRNIGTPVNETQSIVASSSRSSVGTKESWSATTSTYTAWTNNGAVTGCSNWSPDPTTITVGQSFTQTATNCQQAQTRSRQDREQESTTKAIRNVGVAVTESQSITASSTRTSTGTKETWNSTTSTYTAWTNNGAVTGCSNWSPAPSTVTINQSFTQTATDCQQAQTRSRQDREQESTTGSIRNKGVAVTESQSIAASSTRSATGTKETWVATSSTYTGWANSGAVTGCSNWTPDPSTVTYGTAFTQTATNCQQSQTRSRQDREQETTTGAVRNVGSAVTETQSVGASSTRSSTGTKENWVATTPSYTAWTNSGGVFSCSTWTPSTDSVKRGNGFTQYATCVQTQIRTKQNREQDSTTGAIRNSGAAVTESQNVSVGSSRAATGTYYCDRICQGGK